MTDRRRSPYLILGLPFGASKRDAAAAFARATRRLRSSANPPFDIEDLNWALHAIEQRSDDPNTSIDDYRLPANPALYDVADGEGVLKPPIERLERRSGPSDPEDIAALWLQAILKSSLSSAAEIERAPLPSLYRFEQEGS